MLMVVVLVLRRLERAVVRERKRKLGIFQIHHTKHPPRTHGNHVTNLSEATTDDSESDTWIHEDPRAHLAATLRKHTRDPNSLKTPRSSGTALRAHLAATLRKHTTGANETRVC